LLCGIFGVPVAPQQGCEVGSSADLQLCAKVKTCSSARDGRKKYGLGPKEKI
jgi:hypothetical protein